MIFIKKWNTMLLFFQGHLVWKEKSNWKVHSYFKFIIYFYTLLFDKNCFVICSKIFIISKLNFCKTFFLKNVDAWFCLHDHSLPINLFLSLQNDLTKRVNLISFFNRFTKLSCLFFNWGSASSFDDVLYFRPTQQFQKHMIAWAIFRFCYMWFKPEHA